MKYVKSLALLSAFALPLAAQAQVSPFVGAQIEAATKSCTQKTALLSGQNAATAKSLAIAALPDCYNALRSLDQFEKSNGQGLTADERNYFYYMGGNIVWLCDGRGRGHEK